MLSVVVVPLQSRYPCSLSFMSKTLGHLFKLLRPRQYLKNVAIVIGAGASGLIFEGKNIQNLFLGILSFSILSSAIYVLNDLKDIGSDRQHPSKSSRPLASGSVTVNSGRWLFVSLLFLSLLTFVFNTRNVSICLLVYFSINIFYSLGGKNIVVLELLLVASGFVLRGLVGVYCVGAEPSMWFNLLAMFASLFLISGKRLAEKNNLALGTEQVRPSVKKYSREYLMSIRTVSVSGLLMTYFLMIEDKTQNLVASSYSLLMQFSLLPFIYCVLSMSYFTSISDIEEPHTIILQFKPLFIGGLIWLTLYGFAIYGFKP